MNFAVRDLRSRYNQAVFGVAWAVAQPLALVGILAVVFARFAGVPSGNVPYIAFALAGAIVWTYCSSAVAGATESMTENAALVTKVYFPRLLAPVAALLAPMIALAVGLVVLAAVMGALRLAPPPAVAILPIVILWAMLASLGPGLLLATLNVRYRDVSVINTPLLQLWLLVTPVGYPASLVSGPWQVLYGLNPLAGVAESFRWCVLGTGLEPIVVTTSLGATAVLLAAGLVYFAISERSFADRI